MPLRATDDDPNATRPCTSCRKLILSSSPYKMCEHCREKKREHSRRYQDRKAERALLEIKQRQNAVASSSSMQASVPDHVELKRKMEEAHGEAKKKSKLTHATSQDKKASTATIPGVEYRCASEMYDVLKVVFKTKSSRFRGHFSIVAGADISHKKRVKMVLNDLLGARIPIE
ncbi:hypothetical protein H0H93_005212 [Arthromyces matolae]|nr:hypothetical protein H0H93_005212 [Arthromyces matolae]